MCSRLAGVEKPNVIAERSIDARVYVHAFSSGNERSIDRALYVCVLCTSRRRILPRRTHLYTDARADEINETERSTGRRHYASQYLIAAYRGSWSTHVSPRVLNARGFFRVFVSGITRISRTARCVSPSSRWNWSRVAVKERSLVPFGFVFIRSMFDDNENRATCSRALLIKSFIWRTVTSGRCS